MYYHPTHCVVIPEPVATVLRTEEEHNQLDAWKPGSMEAWKHGSMEAWKLGSLEAWKLGSLEAWKPGSLEVLRIS